MRKIIKGRLFRGVVGVGLTAAAFGGAAALRADANVSLGRYRICNSGFQYLWRESSNNRFTSAYVEDGGGANWNIFNGTLNAGNWFVNSTHGTPRSTPAPGSFVTDGLNSTSLTPLEGLACQ